MITTTVDVDTSKRKVWLRDVEPVQPPVQLDEIPVGTSVVVATGYGGFIDERGVIKLTLAVKRHATGIYASVAVEDAAGDGTLTDEIIWNSPELQAGFTRLFADALGLLTLEPTPTREELRRRNVLAHAAAQFFRAIERDDPELAEAVRTLLRDHEDERRAERVAPIQRDPT